MNRGLLRILIALTLAALACENSSPSPSSVTVSDDALAEPTPSIFDSECTTYGFFPSPPEATSESVLNHFRALEEHADFILIQPNIPWDEFVDDEEGESERRTDLRNQTILAGMNGLGWIFVVDPLNGLNRREFIGLPESWEANFSNPDVRQVFTNFTLWIVREFEPRYLGLASEINTYLDAHPDDVDHFMSLYREVYERVKAEAPETQIFVTFQWDDLNNMFGPAAEGRPAFQTNWEQVEAFEPRLDLWVISSYPYFAFPGGEGIPEDYYTPLLDRTEKPLAVAEGGWSSQSVGPIGGDQEGQVAYLQAIHDQIGGRLDFWVYLILSDLNMDSIADAVQEGAFSESDLNTLGMFAHVGLRLSDGTPKPALETWDGYRGSE
jgi:hypothetical protein